MPKRSKVFLFGSKLRAKLDRRLVKSGFGDYAEHVEWLARQGAQISLAALHRYGQALENLFAAGAPAESTIGKNAHARNVAIQTGTLIVIVEPSTRKTWTYSTLSRGEIVRERIERALSVSRKRQITKSCKGNRR